MSNLRLKDITNSLFTSKSYKQLNVAVVIIYVLFMFIYIFREKLYSLGNEYITVVAWTAPNLVPSFLFTLVGIFYILPIVYKGTEIISQNKFIWIVNGFNLVSFALIEYFHVFFNLSVWDNKDMIASLIGIIGATFIYFKFRKKFV